jgi:serine protease Do
VLLNDVPDDSPAAKSGLHTGDVITAANGQAVTSVSELQHLVIGQISTRTVELQVVRDKKSRKITVHW